MSNFNSQFDFMKMSKTRSVFWFLGDPGSWYSRLRTKLNFQDRCDSVQRVGRADVARFMLATAVEGIQNSEDKNKKQIALGTE